MNSKFYIFGRMHQKTRHSFESDEYATIQQTEYDYNSSSSEGDIVTPQHKLKYAETDFRASIMLRSYAQQFDSEHSIQLRRLDQDIISEEQHKLKIDELQAQITELTKKFTALSSSCQSMAQSIQVIEAQLAKVPGGSQSTKSLEFQPSSDPKWRTFLIPKGEFDQETEPSQPHRFSDIGDNAFQQSPINKNVTWYQTKSLEQQKLIGSLESENLEQLPLFNLNSVRDQHEIEENLFKSESHKKEADIDEVLEKEQPKNLIPIADLDTPFPTLGTVEQKQSSETLINIIPTEVKIDSSYDEVQKKLMAEMPLNIILPKVKKTKKKKKKPTVLVGKAISAEVSNPLPSIQESSMADVSKNQEQAAVAKQEPVVEHKTQKRRPNIRVSRTISESNIATIQEALKEDSDDQEQQSKQEDKALQNNRAYSESQYQLSLLQRKIGESLTTELKALIEQQPNLSNKTLSVATASSGLNQILDLKRDVSTIHMIKNLASNEKKESFKQFSPTRIKAEKNENVKALMQQQNENVVALKKYHNILEEKLPKLFSKMLEKHQILNDETKLAKKFLHFAFLFAGPLMKQVGNHLIEVLPQLNYHKEYEKIKECLDGVNKQIFIQKRQCTRLIIHEVLAQKPIGLHFSGHGKTRAQIERENDTVLKDEGDYLLIEDEVQAFLLSRDKLKQIIFETQCQLEFVVLLNCHSQDQGEIFIQAGAKHVICIKREEEVQDKASILFAEAFYKLIFQENMSICVAYKKAREIVHENFGKEEEKFMLLVEDHVQKGKISLRFSQGYNGDGAENKKHACTFLPLSLFKQGKCVDTYEQKQILKQRARRHELIGRTEVVYKLVTELLKPFNKIYTVWGHSGMGKEAIVDQALSYVSERSLIKGGFVYVDAKGIRDVQKFFRKVQFSLFDQHEEFFGNEKEEMLKKMSQDSMSSFLNTAQELNDQKQTVVFIFKNCEGLIEQERVSFIDIMLNIQSQLEFCKIILITTQRLEHTIEQLILIQNLTNEKSAKLFKQAANRTFSIKEEKELWNYTESDKKFGSKQELKDHKLIELLGGSPQAIQLIAPLLSEPSKNLELLDVYKLLENQMINNQFQQQSLNISIGIAFNLIQKNEDAIFLLFLISMFPGDVKQTELKILWKTLQEQRSETNFEWKTFFNQLVGSQLCICNNESDSCCITSEVKDFAHNELVNNHGSKFEILLKVEKKYLSEKVLYFYRCADREQMVDEAINKRNFLANYVHADTYGLQHYLDKFEKNNQEKNKTSSISVGSYSFLRLCNFDYSDESKNDIRISESIDCMFGQNTLRKTSKAESSIQEEFQNDEENKLVSQKTLTLANKFVGQISNKNKPKKLWSWACQQIIKIQKAKKMHQAGEIVDMKAIKSFNQLHGGADDINEKDNSFSNDVLEKNIEQLDQEISKQKENKKVIRETMLDKRKRIEKMCTELFLDTITDQSVENNFNPQLKPSFVKKLMKASQEAKNKSMSKDEIIVLVHNTNLFLVNEVDLVIQWMEARKDCWEKNSKLFQANMKRLHALCLFEKFERDSNQEQDQDNQKLLLLSLDRILMLLKDSQLQFQETDAVWGEGLAFYQMASVYKAANKHLLIDNAPAEIKSYLPSVERVRQEMNTCFEESLDRFKKIDHYLGIALTNEEIANAIIDENKTFWQDESIDTLSNQENEKQRSFKLACSNARSQWNQVKQSFRDRDICLERKKGEEFSLLTEVVKFASTKPLFATGSKQKQF